MMMMEMPGGTTGTDGGDNGAGEAEGGRRRRRRAAPGPGSGTPLLPAVSPEVLNRAAQRVLASIDAAMLVYKAPRRRAAGTCPAPRALSPKSKGSSLPSP